MVRKIVLSLIAVLVLGAYAFAQNKQVSGTVSDANGNPVAGATVMVDGTSIGTTTNAAGQYSLSAPADGTLSVTFIGYVGQQLPIAGKSRIDVTMHEDTQAIDDVIVVAFGTTTKEAFTGSATVVKAEDIAKRQVSNVAQALAGAAAGVQVASSSGNPTSTPTVLIRGLSSISAGVTPLYVIDGVPYSGDLNMLNTSDIETLTVLKDAASTALYGARGANGVIMITTKRAKGREAVVSFDAKWGVNSRATRLYDYIDNPGDYYETYYKSLYNYYLASGTADQAHMRANNLLTSSNAGGLGYQVYTVPDGEYFIGTNGKINPNATLGRKVIYNGQDYWLRPDDWEDEAYRTSLRQEYNVNISAASDRANFYASLGYLDNEGIVANSSFTRYSARLRADYQAKKWLKVGANASYSHYESKALQDESGSGGTTNVFAIANQIAPIYPVYVRDGNGNIMRDDNGYKMYDYGDGMNAGLNRPFLPNSNALQAIRLNSALTNGNAFSGTAFADIKLHRDLTATVNIGTNLDEARSNTVTNPFYGQFAGTGRVVVGHQRTYEVNAQQMLNYNHTFGTQHRFSAMIGHEFYNLKSYTLSGAKQNMFSIDNNELNGAVVDTQNAASYTTEYNNEGYFGRVEYEYDNRIVLNGSYRRDASSRFHPDHRWGNFWSASAAWLINRESWFRADWVDMLKLKASVGSQGNDNISNYLYVDYYSIEPSGEDMSIVFSQKGNELITWETNTNINAGVDFELFRGRLGGTVEYFNRKTSDMLFWFSVAPSMGYSGYYANVGDMRNSGFEIDLHGTPIQTKNFRWNLTLNMSHYKNKVTKLASERKNATVEGYDGYIDGNKFVGEGLSYYTWYIPKYAGVDQETGLSMWYKDVKDAKGNVTGRTTTTTYSEATNYLGESSLPDLYGGFTTAFEFYGVDISAAFAYQIGGKSYDSGYAAAMASPYGSMGGTNIHKDIAKSWTPENPSASVPRFQYGDDTSTSLSDRFLLDASYLNISNIQVGYTLPVSFTRKFGVERLRVYLACDNVYYWSKREGFDPRYSFTGTTGYTNYAPIRTISGGINIQF